MRVQLRLASGEIETETETISVGGFGVHLPLPVDVGTIVDVSIHLRDGRTIIARAESRNIEGARCGFALEMSEEMARTWSGFLAEEEETGNLWQLIGRFASTSGAEKELVRSALELNSSIGVLFKKLGAKDIPSKPTAMRYHVVGENGEAYRVAFEKYGGVPPEKSDLVALPGFKALAIKVAARVLKTDVTIRRDARAAPSPVRVVELQRGGHAMVHGGHNGVPVGLVSLAIGELILIEVDGNAVFPFFGVEDLERIACDTYRKEERRRATESLPARELPLDEDRQPVEQQDLLESAELIAVWNAQDQAPRATRRYGARVIELFPQVWARAMFADGLTVTGPTMRDGRRLLMLVLEGAGAPRVARLERASAVSLISRDN